MSSYNRPVFYLFVILSYSFANCIVLRTKQGVLKGDVSSSRNGRTFYSFYSIPYAEPPVGELRFQDPVPAKSWEGVRDATILPPICLNFEGEKFGQEDCLYLNVYTPKISNETLLPVMVFIYGGRFMFGNALPDRYGPHYFMDKDVILITFHYRLGVFGFLSTEDEVIPGNYGLKDGVAVLQWVQKYIDDFGGDKDRVTVFGGSSGSISAALHLISPLSEGLFHRVISQSGVPLEIEKPGKARLNAWKYGSLVGCDGDDVKTSEDLLKCLKNISADELNLQNNGLFTFSVMMPNLPWSPVIENEKVPGAFLVDEPKKLLQRKSEVPWMLGMNSDEGGMLALFTYFGFDGNSGVQKELEANHKIYFPSIFRYGDGIQNNTEKLDLLTEALKCHYFGERNISQNIYGFAKMFTSLTYVRLINECVKLYNGPKYVYYYGHQNRESFIKMYASYSNLDMDVIHGDELISFFNWSSVITPITQGVDLAVSEQMLDLWTNFAANGDPNYKYEDESIWRPTVSSSEIDYLHIENGTFEMKTNFAKEELDFLGSLPI
ncbi:juvenile hormone esterase-like isoform X1 [Planococcus citri]|uniref:juvenile hormone esterase-like isoform X1 n=1 Tax=Planococcus citri TaxID=170843 RepID=UPI0031F8173E